MSWLAWLSTTAVAVWMRETDSIWGYPTILFLHTLGLGILMGSTAAIDFRVLGFAEQLPLGRGDVHGPYAAVHRQFLLN